MCGLCGFVGVGTHTDLAAMTSALVHRGPDDFGYYADESQAVFLGHRRLSIVDLAGGHQPMPNEDGTVYVVFNGEIYNHLDLRRALTAAGHRFSTDHSDTEVLVHGYEEWAEDLPRRLNGMFAFAIYDRRCRRLFLARDRFGEKPLYYSLQRGVFAFASELRALMQHRALDTVLDKRALQKLFAYGFLPAPNALYCHTYKLQAAASLTFDIDTGRLRIQRYWQYRVEPDEAMRRRCEQDLAEELLELLSQAVQRRLMSDVPLGIFLSGGIDSSAMLAMASAHLQGRPLASFSIGFREPSFDESLWARLAAQTVGSCHHEDMLHLKEVRDLTTELLQRLDEPCGDASILPTYWLSKFASGHVKVALGGDGGDELFAGYDPFQALRPAQLYHACVPRVLHRGMRRLIDLLPISTRNMSIDFKLRRSLAGLSYPPYLWNPVWLGPLEADAIAELFHETIDLEDLYSEAMALWYDSGATNIVDRTLEFYANLYLPDNILTKVDRASMMVALEVRAPFLDNDLVAFAQRLPHHWKMRKGVRKYLLKKALAGVLPRQLLHRPKKGFGIPLAAWLREMPATPPRQPVLGTDLHWVDRRWCEHRSGKADHRLFLWCWLGVQYHSHAWSTTLHGA